MQSNMQRMATKRISIFKCGAWCKAAFKSLLRPHFLVILAGFSLTLTTTHFYISYKDGVINKVFERKALNISKTIEQKAAQSTDVLSYLHAVYNASGQYQFEHFNKYTRLLLTRHPEIKALEWTPRITAENRKQFEKFMQKSHPGYQITQQVKPGLIDKADKRDFYYPVMMIEPYAGNEEALGYDLASNPVRLATMQQARDSGKMSATPGLTLVQDTKTVVGFIVFRPVYRGTDIITVSSRRTSLQGFLLAVYHIEDMVNTATQTYDHTGLVVTLVDRTDPDTVKLLYSSNSAYEETINPQRVASFMNNNQPVSSRDIQLAGRNWQLLITPQTGYFQTGFTWKAGMLLTTGIIISLLLAGYMLQLKNNNLKLKSSNALLNNEINDRIHILNRLHETNKKLEQLSREDPLLCIANRRYLDEYLNSEWLRAIRSGFPLSFIMADIDYFKNYNDLYGHVVGDQCLKAVAKILQAVANRPADLVARYGGEEFAIVLPETFEIGARHIAEKIRTKLQQKAIPHGDSEASTHVTVSFGVGTIHPSPEITLPAFIQQVDDALYQAKSSGRDRIKLATLKPGKDNIHHLDKTKKTSK